MTTLYIDTSDNKRVVARLKIDKTEYEVISDVVNRRPKSIVKIIDEVCKKAKVSVQNIDEITVEEGPGSYTGLKVGASVANALSFALDKKVNGKEIGELAMPTYD